MRQWEYMNVKCRLIGMPELNEYGKQGWELVDVIKSIHDTFVLFFKREIEQPKEVTIQRVLDDIDAGRYKATARVRYVLKEEQLYNKATYLSQITFKHRNFGRKSQTELRELIERYTKLYQVR